MMRNNIAGAAPEGVVLYLNGSGKVVMAWDAAGGATVDHSSTASGTPGAGIWLQPVRTGTNAYTGEFATSASGPWTTVASIASALWATRTSAFLRRLAALVRRLKPTSMVSQ